MESSFDVTEAEGNSGRFISRFGSLQDQSLEEEKDQEVFVTKQLIKNPRSSPDGENSLDTKANPYIARILQQKDQHDIAKESWSNGDDNNNPCQEKQKLLSKISGTPSDSSIHFQSSDRIEVLVEPTQSLKSGEYLNISNGSGTVWAGSNARSSVSNGPTPHTKLKTAKPVNKMSEKCVSAPDVRVWIASSNSNKKDIVTSPSRDNRQSCTVQFVASPPPNSI